MENSTYFVGQKSSQNCIKYAKYSKTGLKIETLNLVKMNRIEKMKHDKNRRMKESLAIYIPFMSFSFCFISISHSNAVLRNVEIKGI